MDVVENKNFGKIQVAFGEIQFVKKKKIKFYDD